MIKKTEKLPDWLADCSDRNMGVLWQVVRAYRANRRQGTVGVKTRAMVTSTGKKPYDQKKTGNARRGSFVSPICVGGGVAHGPKARDYRQPIPEKMAHLALKLAIAKRVAAGAVFDGNLRVESGKTKDAAAMLKNAWTGVGKTIVCLADANESTVRAFRNIRGVVLVAPSQLNAIDVMESRSVVLATDAWKVIQARLGK
jgi:large subunit ribosomal protein L4